MPYRFVRFCVLSFLSLWLLPFASAQATLDATYNSPNGVFSFSYPERWNLTENDEFVIAGGQLGRDFFLVDFFNPLFLSTGADFGSDLDEAASNIAEFLEFIGDPIDDLRIDGRDALLLEVDLDNEEGVIFVIEMSDGGVGMVLVLAPIDVISDNEEFITDMVASYDSGRSTGGTTSNFNDIVLRDHAAEDWRDAITELETLGLIASGGSLVFNENSAFFDGIGAWFTPLARRANRRNIVMAATLTFTSDSNELENCSLLARIVPTTSNRVDTFLQVGIDNDNDVYIFDNQSGNDSVFELAPLNQNINRPQHILFIAAADNLTVFVNGELVFDDIEIEDRSGYFGIALRGQGAGSRCEGSNIWVYDAPAFREGVCEVSSGSNVNKRSGPSTSTDRAGTIAAGQFERVVGQTTGTDGFTWWQLADRAWVREDVVTESGDCGRIPQVDA